MTLNTREQEDSTRASIERLNKLFVGEITPGNFVGLTRERLYEIARVGYQLLNSGKHAEAKQVYLGLVAADPYDSVFQCHLAAAHHRLGELDLALERYTEALRFNIANIDALAGRGEIYVTVGEVAKAIADLSAAIKLDPQGERASTLRARAILLAMKRAADAKA